MESTLYYSHSISRDLKSEDEWRQIAADEGWDYQKAIEFEFLIFQYRHVKSNWGVEMCL